MHFGFGGFGMIFFWIAIIAAIIILIKVITDSSRGNKSGDKSPLDTLDKRYASGEIDHDEYVSRKRDIMKH